MTWQDRLLEALERSGHTRAAVSRMAGVSKSFWRDTFDRGQTPSVDNLASVARVLGLSLSELYDGIPSQEFKVTVSRIADGENWLERPDGKTVSLPVFGADYVAVEMRGAVPPGYRPGDVVCGTRIPGSRIDNHVGRECIVQCNDGPQVIRVLHKGSKPGRYTLRSADPRIADIQDARVEWAAPITLVIR